MLSSVKSKACLPTAEVSERHLFFPLVLCIADCFHKPYMAGSLQLITVIEHLYMKTS